MHNFTIHSEKLCQISSFILQNFGEILLLLIFSVYLQLFNIFACNYSFKFILSLYWLREISSFRYQMTLTASYILFLNKFFNKCVVNNQDKIIHCLFNLRENRNYYQNFFKCYQTTEAGSHFLILFCRNVFQHRETATETNIKFTSNRFLL